MQFSNTPINCNLTHFFKRHILCSSPSGAARGKTSAHGCRGSGWGSRDGSKPPINFNLSNKITQNQSYTSPPPSRRLRHNTAHSANITAPRAISLSQSENITTTHRVARVGVAGRSRSSNKLQFNKPTYQYPFFNRQSSSGSSILSAFGISTTPVSAPSPPSSPIPLSHQRLG